MKKVFPHRLLHLVPILLGLILMGVRCNKDDKLPLYHAKGTIIAVTGGCYSETVLIEVENPKGIGLKGTFSTLRKEINISYENAIGVPYFSKIGIPDTVPQTIGTWLYFEYRELTEEERHQSSLFSPDPTIICPAIYGPPSATPFMIVKIISYK